jgi:hypothetical protein
VSTTLLFTRSQAQTAAFPKGGKPSSVGKYFYFWLEMINVAHQSFAASHSHNTLERLSPITLARKPHHANGN